jgi:hypothetical protein
MKLPIQHFLDIQKYHKNNLILAPAGNLGISRNSMPQIDRTYRENFVEWIKSQGVKVRTIRVPARSLQLAQGEYNRDKVGSIIDSGNTEGDPIFISKDGFVVDGNHRLIAHLNLPGASKYITVIELGQDIKNLLDLISHYPNVRYRNLNNI